MAGRSEGGNQTASTTGQDPIFRGGEPKNLPMTRSHHRVVVIGGGNAGLSVAGRLTRMGVRDVAVIEPRDNHVYKPFLSHVAGGTARLSQAVRPQGEVTPRGVVWIKAAVESVLPDTNVVALSSGGQVTYDHLVICPGIEQDWDSTPGLSDAMHSPAGISNYTPELAAKASMTLKSLRSGAVVFSQPAGPASCAGAVQKPMYLACDYWRSIGVLQDISVTLIVPDETVFGMPEIDDELNRKIAEYGIHLRTRSEIVKIDAATRVVDVLDTHSSKIEGLRYDVLHVEPPQYAPRWILDSSLSSAEADGFVEVDPVTLQHTAFANVWALGDAAATTNSKSGGALREQALVVAKNIKGAVAGRAPQARYNGYSVCPFTVSRSTVVFAEFDDTYRPKPTVPLWRGLAKERRLTWILDRHVLPWVYWHMILKGRA